MYVLLMIPIVIFFASPIVIPSITNFLSFLSDDNDDQKGLMCSLRKLFDKNKSMKSLEKTLEEVLDKI